AGHAEGRLRLPRPRPPPDRRPRAPLGPAAAPPGRPPPGPRRGGDRPARAGTPRRRHGHPRRPRDRSDQPDPPVAEGPRRLRRSRRPAAPRHQDGPAPLRGGPPGPAHRPRLGLRRGAVRPQTAAHGPRPAPPPDIRSQTVTPP